MTAPRLRAALACAALAGAVSAQLRVPLDGVWDIAAEPRDEAHSYDRKAAVPAAFEEALGPTFDGVAWYRRTLPLRAEHRGAAVRVEFAAVATHARVLCNGTVVGEHLGGWTPFRVDVTAALQWNGADVLEVRVDETVGHNTQGFLPVIQPHFGGIWQPVTLCIDRGAVLDRHAVFAFGRALPADGAFRGELRIAAPSLPTAGRAAAKLRAELRDGAEVLAAAEQPAAAPAALEFAVRAVRPWSAASPHLYPLRLVLLDEAGAELDCHELRIGFRSLRADGVTVRWNDVPLQVRGLLHWGYSPPRLAPPIDEAHWRRQLEDARSLGFNLVKCCLWVPPRRFYELCDEIGILCWQEYPTWHPTMDQAHKDDLLREYGEFFAHDRSHPSVAFRSITCETGHGADLDVVTVLFQACKQAVPDTLVVDDSSWIGWQRITDFWDEHPYGNNRWLPGRLAEFAKYIAEKGQKPLLLGECIAADTWADRAEWQRRHGETAHWWRPDCYLDQARFEEWLVRELGAAALESLLPTSLDYGMQTRRYQIERLRRQLPFAGYVVSVARDFAKARMGLYDDFDRLKWSAADWGWHGSAMLCLETDDDRRGFVVGGAPVRLRARPVRATTIGEAIALPPLPAVERPTRHRVQARDGELRAAWDVWLLPPFDAAEPGGVRTVDRLDLPTLDWLERGGRVLLRVLGQKHSLRSEAMWYLRGAPFAPAHPVHARLPAQMLIDLQPFDLDGGRVIPWRDLDGEVDPILAFWETHDIAEVRAHLFAADTNAGQGRLLVSCFDRETDAGRYVEHELARHLREGPAPRRSLSAATLAALRGLLSEQKIELPVWRFRTDPDDQGLAAGWQRPETHAAAAPWRDLRAGSHWENQGEDLKHYTGVAWYRVEFDVPAAWQGLAARAVFEGVDDSFEAWLDGEPVGRFGDPATKTTIWLERQVAELGQRLAPGRHVLALRVVDHAGAGGLWKPVFVTTGPADGKSRLLQ